MTTMHSSTLSRTSSAASISSDDAARRTRKRFSSVQLMLLEQLFHQTSHPTREERETVALAAGMEMKSVTIWFQNKRQTERKVALHHATNHHQPSDGHRPAPFPSSPSVLSSPHASTSHIRPARTLSISTHPHPHHRDHTPRRITPPRTRPSLDRVATRSESRLPPPRTPTKPRDPYAALWDNMPSSPLAPPASPPARDLIEFMGTNKARTLEWACAAARLAGKEKDGRRRDRNREERDAGEDTEEDDIEAITPEGSLGVSDAARWQGAHVVRTRPALPRPGFADPLSRGARNGRWPVDLEEGVHAKEVPQDEDMMRAALALCGLGRRSG